MCAAPIDGLAVFEASSAGHANGRAIHGHSSVAYPRKSVGSVPSVAEEFFTRALAEDLSPSDVFRITITSFLDAYNFDVRRLMKCCIHHVLPSGHIIPFCAYNVLYRDGHVPLPAVRRAVEEVIAGGASPELIEQP